MTVEVLRHPTEEDWCGVKARALVTIGKTAINPPNAEWKAKMLRCRHSPIRYLQFSFMIKDIPYWLHTELVRHHIGMTPYVRSQRDDRADNDVPRSEKPQGALVNMIVDMNAEALMSIANRRMCGCATREMQELMQMIKAEVVKNNPEFGPFLVPACMYTGRCNEFMPCGKKALFFEG